MRDEAARTEATGLTRSDAQAAVEAKDQRKPHTPTPVVVIEYNGEGGYDITWADGRSLSPEEIDRAETILNSHSALVAALKKADMIPCLGSIDAGTCEERNLCPCCCFAQIASAALAQAGEV